MKRAVFSPDVSTTSLFKTETIEDFYRNKFNKETNLLHDTAHFNVFRMEDCYGPGKKPVVYARRDFYKITLMRGKNIYHYTDKSVEISGSTLMFFSPHVPYTFHPITEDPGGYFLIFKEAFFTEKIRESLRDFPMFSIRDSKPFYVLTPEQDDQVSQIFMKMLDEIQSDYKFKFDLIRSYVTELFHVALKLQPSEVLCKQSNANARITEVFSELLERQFPIASPDQKFSLRSAKDFADHLAVHVNHLNRAIKETTGKTTTEHIAERITIEAKALLKYTNWNISEISHCLGFEEPSHFNNFFKKHAATTPSAFRVAS
jgi:AraC family transcriptional regulator, transcriptional activator of pobA